MRSLPIDQARLELLYVETVAKTDMAGAQKTHYNDARPLWAVRCLAREADRKPELIEVSVPNLQDLGKVLTPYMPVSFDNLSAMPWNMADGGRSSNGIAFSADGVKQTNAKNGGRAAAVDPAASVVS